MSTVFPSVKGLCSHLGFFFSLGIHGSRVADSFSGLPLFLAAPSVSDFLGLPLFLTTPSLSAFLAAVSAFLVLQLGLGLKPLLQSGF
ncbi:hypothetical protein Bca4012_017983 [Brassica carinata]